MLTLVLAEVRSPASPALDHSVVLRRLRFSPGHPEAGGALLSGGVLPRVLTSAHPSASTAVPLCTAGLRPEWPTDFAAHQRGPSGAGKVKTVQAAAVLTSEPVGVQYRGYLLYPPMRAPHRHSSKRERA
jgi:hypothetical protein